MYDLIFRKHMAFKYLFNHALFKRKSIPQNNSIPQKTLNPYKKLVLSMCMMSIGLCLPLSTIAYLVPVPFLTSSSSIESHDILWAKKMTSKSITLSQATYNVNQLHKKLIHLEQQFDSATHAKHIHSKRLRSIERLIQKNHDFLGEYFQTAPSKNNLTLVRKRRALVHTLLRGNSFALYQIVEQRICLNPYWRRLLASVWEAKQTWTKAITHLQLAASCQVPQPTSHVLKQTKPISQHISKSFPQKTLKKNQSQNGGIWLDIANLYQKSNQPLKAQQAQKRHQYGQIIKQ